MPSPLVAGIYFMLPMLLLCISFALLLGPATSIALSGFGERARAAFAILGCMKMSGVTVILLLIMSFSRFNDWHHEQDL